MAAAHAQREKSMSEIKDAGCDDAPGAEKVRVLRPLNLASGPTGKTLGRGPYVGIAVDVETTGLNVESGKIIELALRRFRYDDAGNITDIDKCYEWREDPGEPLTSEVAALTGLTDEDLTGREIDDEAATRLLRSASFVVAHNAAFDRKWVEARLPDARGLAWCCSMSEIDWRARGFDGRVLGYLLLQSGFYFCGHRASVDVDALIQLLGDENCNGQTALAEMIARAGSPSWIVRARGADFSVKDALRARGYRWDAVRKLWSCEISGDALDREQWWLAANVYAVDANPKALGPDIERVTARTRYL